MKTHKYPIGSVSSGTMREEDLIPAFLDELKSLSPETHAEIISDHEEDLAILDKDSSDRTNDEQEALSIFLNEVLFDALNEYAGPYFYFGAHPGNGADYGFWFDEESFNDAVRYGDILKVEDLSFASIIKSAVNSENESPDHLAVVSDHGNITLYDLNGEEVWSIV